MSLEKLQIAINDASCVYSESKPALDCISYIEEQYNFLIKTERSHNPGDGMCGNLDECVCEIAELEDMSRFRRLSNTDMLVRTQRNRSCIIRNRETINQLIRTVNRQQRQIMELKEGEQ